MEKNSVVIKYLISKGYNPKTDYYVNILEWRQWYENSVDGFHDYHDDNGDKRELYKLGMAKRGCEDWSSILFTEKDKVICSNEENQKYLDTVLKEINFDDVIPENIEKAFASGTVGSVLRVKDAILEKGELIADEKTKYDLVNVTADSIIPLKVEHKNIVDVAFVSETQIGKEKEYYIEMHELIEDGYRIRNIYLNDNGEEIKKEGVLKEYHTHSNIPLFSLMSPRIVNNLQNQNGLGISIYANAIDQLKGTDIAFNNFIMDIYLGGKKVFYNKSLIKYRTVTTKDENGFEKTIEIPQYPDDLTKQQFKILPGDMDEANDKALFQEYNPDLRADENEKIINLMLNIYAFIIGLGKGYYRFENGTVITATQYLGENKDLVDNAKKHRNALNQYTVGIAKAILLLGRILFRESVSEEDEIELTNKDGFLVSEEELQEQYRQDFQAGLMSKKTYLMKARGLSEAEADKELKLIEESNPSIKQLLGTDE